MLGTLFKYDFREVGRTMGPLYAALVALSVVMGALLGVKGNKVYTADDALSVVLMVMMTAWLLLFVAISVIMLMLVAHNYRDTLFGSRGYLTNVLPARAAEHVADKTINGLIWATFTAFMSIVAFAMFFITVVITVVLINPAARQSLLEGLGSISLGSVFSAQSGMLGVAKCAGVAAISFLVFSASAVSWLFAGISLGSMARKHPGLAKAAAFATLALVWLLVANVLATTYTLLLLVQVAFTVVFSAMSVYVLDRHLDLE
ncbi:Uncharacterised protein [Collinsella sp. AK_207A]|uniref:hypothetical protein n=1 Tax=Collinsella sp. AK_207A TaxID=2650472 RepID=UPI001261257D|nr:hypothetical protein [Collinsella sp. AK_207A]VWM03822.1 Uncharacterised protein [Collinsella sp. AK_207A]